jgi:hypothetical protein
MPTFRFVGLENWLRRAALFEPTRAIRGTQSSAGLERPQVRTLDGFVPRRTGDDKIYDFALSANPGGADTAPCRQCQ